LAVELELCRRVLSPVLGDLQQFYVRAGAEPVVDLQARGPNLSVNKDLITQDWFPYLA